MINKICGCTNYINYSSGKKNNVKYQSFGMMTGRIGKNPHAPMIDELGGLSETFHFIENIKSGKNDLIQVASEGAGEIFRAITRNKFALQKRIYTVRELNPTEMQINISTPQGKNILEMIIKKEINQADFAAVYDGIQRMCKTDGKYFYPYNLGTAYPKFANSR